MSRRLTMTREITKTTIKLVKIEYKEDKPVMIELPDLVMIGNIRHDRAVREVKKLYPNEVVHVVKVQPDTQVYEMAVEEFLKHAKLRTNKNNKKK